MVKSYTFNERNEISKRGIKLISRYLFLNNKTIDVINVENDPTFRKEDVDLLWIVNEKTKRTIKIEVKTDNYTTGNFWIETLSNESKKTLGCFLKTKADYFYYYFIRLDILYIIPINVARKWFLKNIANFKASKTKTKDHNGEYLYTTKGYLVPIKVILSEVPNIKKVDGLNKLVA